MFSRRTQPVMEDMVSVFESTQNQPWSVFSGKLNGVSIETCKSKNIFKSENPIQLSLKNDYRVFGLFPRLEECKLVSCKKCKMIVKEDCLLHHYNRRHKSGNDTFSLKNFLIPTINSNKHKRQKLNNVRKLTKTKLIDGKIIDPVVQQIKTEFDELDFERLPKIKLENIENKTKSEYNDNNDLNAMIETCCPVSLCDFDWNLKPCTQSLDSCTDNKIEKCDAESNKLLAKLPDDKEELHFHKYGNVNFDNTINYMISSYDLLTKPLILNDELKTNMLSNLITKKKCKDKFKNPYCILDGLLNKENIQFTRDYCLDISDKLFNDIINHNQYTIDEKIDDPLMVNNQLDFNINKISCYSITNLHPLLNNGDNIQYSEVISNVNENNEIVDYSQNQCFQSLNSKKKIKKRINYTSSDVRSYVVNENILNIVTNFYQSFLKSSIFRNGNTIVCKKNKIEPCQLSIEYPINKTLTEFPLSNTYSKGTSDKYINSNTTSNNNSIIFPYTVKEVSTLTFNYKNTSVKLNEYSDNVISNYDQSSVTPFIDIESSNTSLFTNSYNVDDHYFYREYYHSCKLAYDKKENCEINDHFFNSYILPSELQNDEDNTQISPINDESSVVTSNEDSNIFSNFDESTAVFVDNTEESKPKPRFDYSFNMIKEDDDNSSNTLSDTNDKNEYYYLSECINNDVSSAVILNNYDYSDTNNEDSDDSVTSCDQSSIESLDTNDETNNLSNATSDECFSSDTSQSISETLDVLKETKSVQNDLYLESKDYEPSIDSKCKVGESLIQLLNDFENNTNCIPTNTFVDGREDRKMCHNTVNSNSNVDKVEDFINSNTTNSSNDKITKDGYISVKSSALASESSANGFTSVISSAKILNNTIIPISTEKCRKKYELIDNNAACNQSTSNSSHNTSYFQQIPFNTDNQNDNLKNCIIHSPIINNNDKAFNSEPCTNKQNDHIHHDTSGSPLFKECLKKAADETNVIYGKNYKIDNNVPKVKNNLKRHYAVKVAGDKENHKLWKYGTFKKRRLEFIVRKVMWSDESDYNDNDNE